jgi:ATP-dependent helicase HrpB
MFQEYPIVEILPELKRKLQSEKTLILQAPPGAGKSTILPLELCQEPWLAGKKIIMLEPRRLAAKSVAERMSFLRDEKVGETVGYRVRFDTKIGPQTKIEVVTEGILTRMIQSDNSLEDVGMLMFDEFHERSLHADLALTLSLQIQQVLRPDLRIMIMSATLDSAKLSSSLGGVPVISCEGKQYPVDIRYEQRDSDTPISARMSQAIRKALREESGDILAFLPGAGEIRSTLQLLEQENVSASLHPLYGDLSFRQQQEAILPNKSGLRKIVLATSIAETSLTIEGISIVIDGGLSRVPRFDPRSGLTRLETIRVTKDAADQRAGRAGRLGPGVCYRLWSDATQRNLQPQRNPEIMEADLASMLLEVAQWGVRDVNELTWVAPPPSGAVSQAKDLLTRLEAIDEQGITKWGRDMLKLPTHPRISHMLLKAKGKTEQALVTDVAAVLEERDPLGKELGADLSLRVECVRKFRSGEKVFADRNAMERIERLAENWRRLLKADLDNNHPDGYVIGKLLMAAYPERIARQQSKQSESFSLSNGRVARLPAHDPLVHETWLCVAHLDAGQREGKIFLAAPVDESDLQSLEVETIRWDEDRHMVTAALEKRVGTLLLGSKPIHQLDEQKKNAVLLEVIRQKGLAILNISDDARLLQARIQSLRKWRPEDHWPDFGDEHLLATLESWLPPFLAGIYKQSEMEKLDFSEMLFSLLPWELRNRLETLAPSRLPVPSGSMISIQYFPDGRPPVMEVRLQEMFGLQETPAVNEGRTKILLHLLSPGYKPVQVTQDLKSFWHTTYHEVRKELRMRYPKHSWPEDPWTAVAVRGVKKRN